MCIWIFFLFVCVYCFRENRIGSLCLFVLKSISAMSFIPNQVKQCLQQFAQFNTGCKSNNCFLYIIDFYYHIQLAVNLNLFNIRNYLPISTHLWSYPCLSYLILSKKVTFTSLRHSVKESIFLAMFKNMLWILHAGKKLA